MIPTAHLRLYKRWVYAAPVLQQLWAPALGDQSHSYLLAWLEENGGEWRDVPTITAPVT